jgi:hypothetical protein
VLFITANTLALFRILKLSLPAHSSDNGQVMSDIMSGLSIKSSFFGWCVSFPCHYLHPFYTPL